MMVSVADLRAAKRLSTATWDSLSPEDRRYAHSLLGSMYHYYDDLATHTAFANGRIEMLREALQAIAAYDPGEFRPLEHEIAIWRLATEALKACSPKPWTHVMSSPVQKAFDEVERDLGSAAAHAVYNLIRAVMNEHDEEEHRSADPTPASQNDG